MKILLTGNQGYIGSVLGPQLLRAGHEVVGLDTGYYAAGCLYPPAVIKTVKKDIRRVKKSDVSGFDAVIHLAELSNDPLGAIDPALTDRINHRGTVGLARVAKAAGVTRFIYFSSCSVYGAGDKLSGETSPVNPLTAYAQAKVLNEKFLRRLADKNFSPLIFRLATVFGASPRMRFDLAVNNLCASAYTAGKIVMSSDGEAWRPFVHVQDVCRAVILAVELPAAETDRQIINVGANEMNYQIKTAAAAIAKIFPGCGVSLRPGNGDQRNYRVSFDKISRLLPGFVYRFDVAAGARELLDLFNRVNLTRADFDSPRYTRLKRIEQLIRGRQVNDELYWR